MLALELRKFATDRLLVLGDLNEAPAAERKTKHKRNCNGLKTHAPTRFTWGAKPIQTIPQRSTTGLHILSASNE
jgi:hypothetical protein